MRRSPRRILLATLSALFVLVVYLSLFNNHASKKLADITIPAKLLNPLFRESFTYSKNRPPKITVIVIWTPHSPTPPNYFPYFFQSVKANPQVDLLFIQVDKSGKGCVAYSNSSNVQDICLSERQYHELHVEFLCKRWKCTEEDKFIIYNHIKKKSEGDKNNTFFRILRNGIFLRWIDPATTIWGWCDVDEFWGNFTRTFPWDIAHDYDVMAISSQPEFANQRLIFTRGHMAFFRHSPEVLEKLHSFPKFNSLSAYLTLPDTRLDAEESEFSHYIFSDEESFTFLSVEGMSESYDTVFVSEYGVFYVPLSHKDMTPEKRKRLLPLIRPQNKAPVVPSFSEDGVEKRTRVFTDGRYYEGGLWFEDKDCTFVETGWDQTEREQKAYFMRRTPYGRVMQRYEPRERYLNRDRELAVDECLYKHWQVEKHRPWFRKLPKDGLKPGQIFVQYHGDEAEIWNEQGEVVYRMEDSD